MNFTTCIIRLKLVKCPKICLYVKLKYQIYLELDVVLNFKNYPREEK